MLTKLLYESLVEAYFSHADVAVGVYQSDFRFSLVLSHDWGQNSIIVAGLPGTPPQHSAFRFPLALLRPGGA